MHLPIVTVLSALPSTDEKYIHLLLRLLRTQNHKSKEYKLLLKTFVERQIIRHHKNWPARVYSTIRVVRLEIIHR
jgi:hypothetical protein